MLEADGWTLYGLAYAKVYDLTKYDGIGPVTAKNVIKEAKVLLPKVMAEERAVEAADVQKQDEPQQAEQAVSVRVKRIRDANQ